MQLTGWLKFKCTPEEYNRMLRMLRPTDMCYIMHRDELTIELRPCYLPQDKINYDDIQYVDEK